MNLFTTAETILVVDDHESLCELIEIILSRAGYRVLTAHNGAEALRLARKTLEIDLLVSDLEMPGMRGEELARRFASLHPSAPVVFVAKPFTVAELCATVRRALRSRPALAELLPAA